MKPGGLTINFGKSIKKGVFVAPVKPAASESIAPASVNQFGEDDEEEATETGGGINSVQAVNAAQFGGNSVSSSIKDNAEALSQDAFFDSRDKAAEQKQKVKSSSSSTGHLDEMRKQLELRKREQSLLHDRMLLKEVEREDHLYENSLKFVTNAYKRKMAEDAEFIKELEIRDSSGGTGAASNTNLSLKNTKGIQIMGAYQGTLDPKSGFTEKPAVLSELIQADEQYGELKDEQTRQNEALGARERYLLRKKQKIE